MWSSALPAVKIIGAVIGTAALVGAFFFVITREPPSSSPNLSAANTPEPSPTPNREQTPPLPAGTPNAVQTVLVNGTPIAIPTRIPPPPLLIPTLIPGRDRGGLFADGVTATRPNTSDWKFYSNAQF